MSTTRRHPSWCRRSRALLPSPLPAKTAQRFQTAQRRRTPAHCGITSNAVAFRSVRGGGSGCSFPWRQANWRESTSSCEAERRAAAAAARSASHIAAGDGRAASAAVSVVLAFASHPWMIMVRAYHAIATQVSQINCEEETSNARDRASRTMVIVTRDGGEAHSGSWTHEWPQKRMLCATTAHFDHDESAAAPPSSSPVTNAAANPAGGKRKDKRPLAARGDEERVPWTYPASKTYEELINQQQGGGRAPNECKHTTHSAEIVEAVVPPNAKTTSETRALREEFFVPFWAVFCANSVSCLPHKLVNLVPTDHQNQSQHLRISHTFGPSPPTTLPTLLRPFLQAYLRMSTSIPPR